MTRHRLDVFSLLAGAIAVTIGTVVLVGAVPIRLIDLRISGPVVVLALGLALLVGGGRDRGTSASDEDVPGSDPGGDPAWHETVVGDAEDDDADVTRDLDARDDGTTAADAERPDPAS